jgi:formylglycine-generating enzyme required for sulfatase activity
MRKWKLTNLVLLAGFLGVGVAGTVWGNNLTIANTMLVNKSTWTYDVQFDISWENSWYTEGAPSPTANWDAAWVFIKFSTKAVAGSSWAPWGHATLLGAGNTIPSGAQIKYGDTGGIHKGVFIYRSSAGTGTTNTWTNTALRWNYGTDEVSSTTVMKVQVFAIEMVFVSTGSFYVGSGGAGLSEFYTSPTLANPYLISSEGAINVGATDGYLYYASSTYGGDQTGPIPAEFPKGYNAFYIMKSEISQRQYCDFLNTLTRTQQAARFVSTTVGNFMNASTGQTTPANRNGVQLISDPGSPYPRVYANNVDNDGTYNESNDGGWTACNWVSWPDGAAYGDWAALRPFTELEFEKACRGGKVPLADEYAWGTIGITKADGISGTATNLEEPSTADANCVFSNDAEVQGPLRSGCMARTSTTRAQAGASYYGVLDLSGNVWERPVTVGNGTPGAFGGRNFTGLHGNGKLDSGGNADVTNWPATDAIGSGFRGGQWKLSALNARVSDRNSAADSFSTRSNGVGFRLSRSSP